MPPRMWSFRVRDILESIERIEEYVQGMTCRQFASDRRTFDAVIRNLIVIGEAANHVPSDVRGLYPDVPWDEMRRLRNLVVHAYFRVEIADVWRTIREDLPPLRQQLEAILRDHPADG